MPDFPVIIANGEERPLVEGDPSENAQQHLFGVVLLLHAIEAEHPPDSPERAALASIRRQVGQALEELAEAFSDTIRIRLVVELPLKE